MDRLAAADRAGRAVAAGYLTTASWLRSACRLSPGGARAAVGLGRRLHDHLPAVGAALREGSISYDHARALSLLTLSRDSAAIAAQVEQHLVTLAQNCDPTELYGAVQRWRAAMEPEAARRKEESCYERRELSLASTLDGMVAIHGLLDPESGELVRCALASLCPPATPGRETRRQRADALTEICDFYLRHGDAPSSGGERPHLVLRVEAGDLLAGTAVATTTWDTTLTVAALRRLGCDANLIRLVTAGPSEILDLGRTQRIVSPAQRRALAQRDGGCVYPGCDRPPPWTDAHHLVHWIDGGATDLANLALLCRRHHRALHEGGFDLRPTPAGTFTVHSSANAPPAWADRMAEAGAR